MPTVTLTSQLPLPDTGGRSDVVSAALSRCVHDDGAPDGAGGGGCGEGIGTANVAVVVVVVVAGNKEGMGAEDEGVRCLLRFDVARVKPLSGTGDDLGDTDDRSA